MSERLSVLAAQIPILEAKLGAMKRERRSLKAQQTMRLKRQDPEFNARTLAAVRRRTASPEERQRFAAVRYNADKKLPWPHGTACRNRYRNLMRKGWTRDLAIEKINAEMRA